MVVARRGAPRAAAGVDQREYLYWKDDTHWNAAGIEVTADAVRAAWQKLAPPSR